MLTVSLASYLAAYRNDINLPVVADLDIQFGDLSTYLDLPPNDNFVKALTTEVPLDFIATKALLTKHDSGISLLSTFSEQVRSAWDFDTERLVKLLDILTSNECNLIVNVSNHLDPLGATVLELCDQVIVVTQQSVPHLRGTRQMLKYLREIGVSNSRTRIVVNRFNRKLEITLQDFNEAFPDVTLHTLAGDFKRVSECINKGMPVLQGRKSSAVGKSVINIAETLWPLPEKKRGWVGRKGKVSA